MSVQDALVGTRIPQNFPIKVTQVRINGRQASNRMPLAQGEQVLALACRIDYAEVYETAVEERSQRNDCRKSTSGVQTLVDRVPALLDIQNTDIRVFHFEQLQDRLTDKELFRS